MQQACQFCQLDFKVQRKCLAFEYKELFTQSYSFQRSVQHTQLILIAVFKILSCYSLLKCVREISCYCFNMCVQDDEQFLITDTQLSFLKYVSRYSAVIYFISAFRTFMKLMVSRYKVHSRSQTRQTPIPAFCLCTVRFAF